MSWTIYLGPNKPTQDSTQSHRKSRGGNCVALSGCEPRDLGRDRQGGNALKNKKFNQGQAGWSVGNSGVNGEGGGPCGR